MANVKFTQEQWGLAREYFEAGLSLSIIEQKTGISKPQISKRAKAESWSKETEKKQLVLDAARVELAKATLNETAISVHDELVAERVHHERFFKNAAIQNVQEAMRVQCESQQDFKFRAETINKGRETVLGKQQDAPTTAVQINNNAAPVAKTLADFYPTIEQSANT